MLNLIKLLAYLIGALAVLYWGIRVVSNSFYSLSGDFFGRLVGAHKRKGLKAFISGFSSVVTFQGGDQLSNLLTSYISIRSTDTLLGTYIHLGTLLGFTFLTFILSFEYYCFPHLMLGCGMFISYWVNNSNLKNTFRIIMGFGIIFWSLQLFFAVVLPIGANLEFFSVIQNNYNILFITFYVFVGALVTILFQNPILILMLAVIMGKTGFVDFPTGMSLLVGVNLGAAFNSVISSWSANSRIRIVSYTHFFFCSVMSIIFIFTVQEIVLLVEKLIPPQEMITDFYGAFGFKILIGYLMINFVTGLISFILLRPTNAFFKKNILILGDSENRKNQYPEIDPDLIPACALVEIYKEIEKFAHSIDNMFECSRSYIFDEKKSGAKLLGNIKSFEKDADVVQGHLTFHLCKIMEKKLTAGQSFEAQGFVRIADELESITDYLEKVAVFKTRLVNEGFDFELVRKEFIEYFDRVYDYYKLVLYGFQKEMIMDLGQFSSISEELKIISQEIREKYLDDLSKSKSISPLSVLTYSDMIVSLRKIRGHIFNISQTLCRINMAA